jgi:inhibitor of cysteine peptidase
MKKTLVFLLVLILMTGMMSSFGMASSGETVTILLDGEKVGFPDAQPIHTGGRVLVPVRGFFERIGVAVDWNSGDRIVIVKDDEREIMMEVGNKAVLNNGAVNYLDCSVIVRDNRAYIPLRYVSESFGYDVQWEGETKSVRITKKSGGTSVNAEELPAVDSLENLVQLLGYNEKLAGYVEYNSPKVTDIRDFADQAAESSASDEKSNGYAASTPQADKPAADSSDFSGTNNQVEGIEEGDLIKTDGKYIYIVRDRKITIVDSDPNNLKIVSEISSDGEVTEIFIYRNKLIVINGRSHIPLKGRDKKESRLLEMLFGRVSINSTNVRVYDISDSSVPRILSDRDYEGTYLSSRMIDDDVYIVTNSRVRLYASRMEDIAGIIGPDGKQAFMDKIAKATAQGQDLLGQTGFGSCDELYDALIDAFTSYVIPRYRDNIKDIDHEISLKEIRYFRDLVTPNYLMTTGIDLDSGKDDVSAYLGSSGQLYVSADHMYAAVSRYEYNALKSKVQRYPVYENMTSVYKFALKDGRITYNAKGTVPGTIVNQFSMDEYDGAFRIATTTSDSGSTRNNVYALDEGMKITGRLEGIAPGEKIYSTRFAGERIYMVTFRQMDPFFVIDAADPERLTMLGYLKIPGFSSYMHILDKDHVLGLGYDTEERTGWGIDTTGFKISLFDVSDVDDPIEVKNETIGEKAQSPAAEDHKALMISLDKGIMGFPLAYINSDSDYFAGYYLYNITNRNFTYKGRVSHVPENAAMMDIKEEDMISRGIYIGDYLYTFSREKLQVHDLGTLKLKNSLTFR